MEQGVKYVMDLEDLLSYKLVDAERTAVSFESALDNINASARRLGYTLGVTFAAREIYEFGKSIVDVSGKMESFRNLINFSSADAAEAARNQSEVMKAVTDYRLPLMETYDQYSRFLGAVKGSPVEGEKARQTFDDLAKSLAVMHLPAERAGRALYAVQEMFAEGRVQTRHFLRQLAIALPGIDAEAAKVMGVSISKFNEMLTHQAGQGQINAYEFLPKLFKQLAEDWGDKLPTALKSIVSETTDLRNQWMLFKDDMGEKLKPELIEVFDTLRKGIGWLKTHEEDLIKWGGILIKVGEGYIMLRGAMLAMNLVTGLWNTIAGVALSNTARQTVATAGETAAIQALTTAILELNAAQTAAAASATEMTFAQQMLGVEEGALYEAQMLAKSNALANLGMDIANPALMESAAGTAAGSAAMNIAGIVSVVSTVLINAGVVAASVLLMDKLLDTYKGSNGRIAVANDPNHIMVKDEFGVYHSAADSANFFNKTGLQKKVDDDLYKTNLQLMDQTKQFIVKLDKSDPKNPKYTREYGTPGVWGFHSEASNKKEYDQFMASQHSAFGSHLDSQSDKITGQRVVNYHITIQKMNGIENVHTTTVRESISDAANSLQTQMLRVVNDSQIKDSE